MKMALRWTLLPLICQAHLAAKSPGSDEAHAGACSQRLFGLLGDPSYDGFVACVDPDAKNLTLPGRVSNTGAYARCWCEWNMSSFISAQKCSSDPNWKWLMQVGCGVDCEEAKALQCRSCPSLCFEVGSHLHGCGCHDECLHYLSCAEDSQAHNISENSSAHDHEAVCHELKDSQAMSDFGACAAGNYSYTNPWSSLSATFQCMCDNQVQQELESGKCCSSHALYGSFCQANCSMDCTSKEAQECVANCSQICETQGHKEDCNRTCLLEDAPCNRYKVCAAKHLEPQSHAGFSYFCDDGSAPDPSGCCQILFTRHAQCPMLCEYGWKSVRWSAQGWKRHCQCGGCPGTIEEARAIVNESLPVVLEHAATKELMFILMTRGLNSLSSEMRHLFAMQSEAMQKDIVAYRGDGLINQQLVRALRRTYTYYFKLLSEAADQEMVTVKVASSSGMVWFVLLAGLCVCMTLVMGIVVSRSMKHRPQAPPVPAENQLVVGRPIEGKPPPESVQGVLVGHVAYAQP